MAAVSTWRRAIGLTGATAMEPQWCVRVSACTRARVRVRVRCAQLWKLHVLAWLHAVTAAVGTWRRTVQTLRIQSKLNLR